jgi:hypothetical protein
VNVIAIVISFGRAELGELLTQWLKQTRPTPLLVWLDGYEGVVDVQRLTDAGIYTVRAPHVGANSSIGAVRAAAVTYARGFFRLGPQDGFLVLDDDDYYSPHHAARTIEALERAPHGWTGAARIAIQWRRDMMPPELIPPATFGPGQHACWGLRLDTYDRAGGYSGADVVEDMRLADRIGWQCCSTHQALTHVRRQFGPGISAGVAHGMPYDRAALRRVSQIADCIVPTWRPELADLECWTLERERSA